MRQTAQRYTKKVRRCAILVEHEELIGLYLKGPGDPIQSYKRYRIAGCRLNVADRRIAQLAPFRKLFLAHIGFLSKKLYAEPNVFEKLGFFWSVLFLFIHSGRPLQNVIFICYPFLHCAGMLYCGRILQYIHIPKM